MTVWERRARQTNRRQGDGNEKIDLVSIHQHVPQIAAAYHAARTRGANRLQSIHKLRLIGPAACSSEGRDKSEKVHGHARPWPAIKAAATDDEPISPRRGAGMLRRNACWARTRGRWDAYTSR